MGRQGREKSLPPESARRRTPSRPCWMSNDAAALPTTQQEKGDLSKKGEANRVIPLSFTHLFRLQR